VTSLKSFSATIAFSALLLVAEYVSAEPHRPDERADGEIGADPSELLGRSGAGEFNLRAEAGGGLMLSEYQRDRLGFDKLAQGTLRLGLNLSGSLGVQLSAGSYFFPADGQSGQMFAVLQGLRFDTPIGNFARWFLDGNFGVAETVRHTRAGLDAGTGFELPLFAYFELGPFVRYHRVFAATPDYPSDASFISFGVSASARRLGVPRPRPRGFGDGDGDGVSDADDLCPQASSEPHPDPARPGCPARRGGTAP
jgi:hypothetical protein